MKPKIEMIIPFLVISTLFLAPHAYAATDDEPIIVQPIINIDLEGIIGAIEQLNTDVTTDITNTPTSMLDIFTIWVNELLVSFNNPILEFMQTLLTSNPDIEPLYGAWQSIVIIISSFYLLVFITIGFMFLFFSLEPQRLAIAKTWLMNFIKAIVGVSMSYWLYQIILAFSTGLTTYLWISGFESLFTATPIGSTATFSLFFSISTGILAMFTLFIRYIFLFAATLIFPIGIFLYFMPPTKAWGKLCLNFIWIFLAMQFIDVIILSATYQATESFAGETIAQLIPPLAFMVIGILNLLLMIYAVLKSALTSVEESQILAFAVGALTSAVSRKNTPDQSYDPSQTRITKYGTG